MSHVMRRLFPCYSSCPRESESSGEGCRIRTESLSDVSLQQQQLPAAKSDKEDALPGCDSPSTRESHLQASSTSEDREKANCAGEQQRAGDSRRSEYTDVRTEQMSVYASSRPKANPDPFNTEAVEDGPPSGMMSTQSLATNSGVSAPFDWGTRQVESAMLDGHMHIHENLSGFSLIGQGGCGSVYRAQWMGAPVAVKIIVSNDEQTLQGSVVEAVMNRMLAHPNVVHTYFAGSLPVEDSWIVPDQAEKNLSRVTDAVESVMSSVGMTFDSGAVVKALLSQSHKMHKLGVHPYRLGVGAQSGAACPNCGAYQADCSCQAAPESEARTEYELGSACRSESGSGTGEEGSKHAVGQSEVACTSGRLREAGWSEAIRSCGAVGWSVGSSQPGAEGQRRAACQSESRCQHGGTAVTQGKACHPSSEQQHGPVATTSGADDSLEQPAQVRATGSAMLAPLFSQTGVIEEEDQDDYTVAMPQCSPCHLPDSSARSPEHVNSLNVSALVVGDRSWLASEALCRPAEPADTSAKTPHTCPGVPAAECTLSSPVEISTERVVSGISGLVKASYGSVGSVGFSCEGYTSSMFTAEYDPGFAGLMRQQNLSKGQFVTCIVMEHCDKGTLLSAIRLNVFKASESWGSGMALRALVRTAREIANGLAYLHSANIIHGDLKPGNVLLKLSRLDRRGFTVRISDFGFSKVSSQDDSSQGPLISTLAYTAPEVLEGRSLKASDVYSFGVLLWEMIVGERPFADLPWGVLLGSLACGTLQLEWPDEPATINLCSLGKNCTHPEPDQRPAADAVAKALASMEETLKTESFRRRKVKDQGSLRTMDKINSSERSSDYVPSPRRSRETFTSTRFSVA